MLPIVIGLAPGVVVWHADRGARHPGWLQLWTYVVLLPLILLQAAGYRRADSHPNARSACLFGAGLGVLYSVTTISGPPLAVMLSNQDSC